MKINVDLLEKNIKKVKKRIKEYEEELKQDPLWKEMWKKAFGGNAALSKPQQFAKILYDKDKLLKKGYSLGLDCKKKTEKGSDSVDDENLVSIDHPFVQKYRRMMRFKKMDGTFLKGIKNHICNGYLYANFWLDVAVTGRSTSSEPNLQNLPIRDPEQGKFIRSLFIPRKGHQFLEADFSGIEVAVACCINQDPKLIEDYTVGDMHRDMAIEVYKLGRVADSWFKEKGELGGHNVRYAAKNGFVFPNFYGSRYVNTARSLWENCSLLKLHAPDGTPMLKYLKSQGIKKLGDCSFDEEPKKGTFELHIKEVEDWMWDERYSVYTRWKKGTWNEYLESGYCKLMTGFVCTLNNSGKPMNRREVINYQIQGPAAHCLIWVLVQMDAWLRKNKMKSRIISEIHDSLILDVHRKELNAVIEHLKWLMEVRLQEVWKWVVVPLRAEIEITEVGGNWYEKKKVG